MVVVVDVVFSKAYFITYIFCFILFDFSMLLTTKINILWFSVKSIESEKQESKYAVSASIKSDKEIISKI